MSLLAFQAEPTGEAFVPSLATVLNNLIQCGPAQTGPITRFHAVRAPDISIHDYLGRIQKYFGCSNECFVLSLVYIDRILKLHESFTVSVLNIHRLLITSVMLAAKFFDDVYYSNAFYARVGGVKTKEINVLEAHFLSLINYQLFVTAKEYDQYRVNILAAVSYPVEPCPAVEPVSIRAYSPSEFAPSESDRRSEAERNIQASSWKGRMTSGCRTPPLHPNPAIVSRTCEAQECADTGSLCGGYEPRILQPTRSMSGSARHR